MRPIRKETAAWLIHLVRVVAGTGGPGAAVEDANSLPEDTRVRPAVRPRAAPFLNRVPAEARTTDRATPVVLAAWIVGGGLGRGVSTPVAGAAGR